MEMVPDVGRRMSSIIRMHVVFPAPLGPRNPQTVPSGTVKETSFTALKSPYDLVTLISSIGAVMTGFQWALNVTPLQ